MVGVAKDQRWTSEEDARLRELWPRSEWSELFAALPGRTRVAIASRGRWLGAEREIKGKPIDNKRSAQEWTVEQDALLRRMWPRSPKAAVRSAFPGKSDGAIRHRASRLGIVREGKEYETPRRNPTFSAEQRKAIGELTRQRKPRLGKGIVAPVFVRDGVPGKACVACLEWKPLERFARHATCAGGRRNHCSTCAGRAGYAANPAARIAGMRRYQRAHPEEHRLRKRAADKKRHGRKVDGPGVTAQQYREIRAAYGGLCAYCGNAADTMDHVVPLSRGGLHSPENIVPACRACNFEKHDKTPEEWRAWKARTL